MVDGHGRHQRKATTCFCKGTIRVYYARRVITASGGKVSLLGLDYGAAPLQAWIATRTAALAWMGFSPGRDRVAMSPLRDELHRSRSLRSWLGKLGKLDWTRHPCSCELA